MARPCLLLVEDEALIPLSLEAMLEDAGYAVTASVSSIATALRELRRCRPDAAVIDVNLRGEVSFPIADELARIEVPFLFLTGHAPEMLPARHRGRPHLLKPCLRPTLLRAIAAIAGPAVPGAIRDAR